jgi:hypothetical protein
MRVPAAVALCVCLVFFGTQGAVAVRTKEPLRVARYSVFEHSLAWSSPTASPGERATVDVTLRSPAGRPYKVGGFYAAANTWKFRFAPPQAGRWSWTARIVDGARTGVFKGSFVVTRGTSSGFVRRSPFNRFRWAFPNGAPYYPIGLNDCTVPDENDDPLAKWGLDGGFRAPGQHIGRIVGIDTYMKAYSSAGFDLFRWGPDNCSFRLYDRISPEGNVYSLKGGGDADRLFATLRRYGFRIEMVLFGSSPPFTSEADDRAKMDAVKRYVRYIVDRYGAYVDFWELMNEASASDAWYSTVTRYLHSIDPYRHPVGTNFSRPALPGMDFGADHWYETEDAGESDSATWARVQQSTAHSAGKPTLIDEQGNVDQNWDPGSAIRMRIRSWTAFFAEGTLVFWNASYAKDNKNPNAAANIYLGPEERQYVRVLQSFTRGFDPRATIAKASLAPAGRARSYALAGPRQYALYLVSGGNREGPISGLRVTVSIRHPGTARWIEPASGRALATLKVEAGVRSLPVPSFTTDLALKIS